MTDTLQVVMPVFALIFSGYYFRKKNLLQESVSQALSNYVVMLALPALLFEVTATSPVQSLWQPGFIWSVTLSALAIFVLIIVVDRFHKRSFLTGIFKALGASYSNTGFMGFSICLFVFGESGLLPALIATLIVVCGMYAFGIVLIEASINSESHVSSSALKTLTTTLKNPLLVSPLCGFVFSASGITLPDTALVFISTLGDSATSCALVSIGAFLASKPQVKEESVGFIVFAKLLLQPFIAWLLAVKVFELEPMWAHAAILLSALPTGTGPYMLVSYYRQDASSVSRIILATTTASLFSVSLCVYLINEGVLI